MKNIIHQSPEERMSRGTLSAIEENGRKLDRIVEKDTMKVELLGVDVVTLKGDKGDKGDTGDKGDKGDSIIGPRGKTGKQGPKPIAGIDYPIPKNGEDSTVPGPKGDKGNDGKDGSPDTPEEIIKKINSSKKFIDAERIIGLIELIRANDSVGMNYGGGGANDSFKVRDEEVNGSGTTFTLRYSPLVNTLQLFRGGARQHVGTGNDFTISGATITLASALSTGEKLLADYEHQP